MYVLCELKLHSYIHHQKSEYLTSYVLQKLVINQTLGLLAVQDFILYDVTLLHILSGMHLWISILHFGLINLHDASVKISKVG